MVLERELQLNNFCKSLLYYTFLYESEEAELFLHGKRQFHKVRVSTRDVLGATPEADFRRAAETLLAHLLGQYGTISHPERRRGC